MTAYYNDLKLFFQRAGAFPDNRVVLHVEPDMWGYIQQRATNDNAATRARRRWRRPASPSWPGCPTTSPGWPRRSSGCANRTRPTSCSATTSASGALATTSATPTRRTPRSTRSATRAGQLLPLAGRGLRPRLRRVQRPRRRLQAVPVRRRRRVLVGRRRLPPPRALPRRRFVRRRGSGSCCGRSRFGNTKMRAMNNTWNHYQDNRVEWLLDDPRAPT